MGDGIDLESELDELFRLHPKRFVAARNVLAKRLQGAGRGADAKVVKGHARPSPSAWLVNTLVLERREQFAALEELREVLRAAQTAGAEAWASAARRKATVKKELSTAARQIAEAADQPFTAQIEREVDTTLEAWLARPSGQGRLTPSPGRLARPLEAAGFDGLVAAVSLEPATEVPPTANPKRAQAPRADASSSDDSEADQLKQAQALLSQAEEQRAQAHAAVAAAEAKLGELQAQANTAEAAAKAAEDVATQSRRRANDARARAQAATRRLGTLRQAAADAEARAKLADELLGRVRSS